MTIQRLFVLLYSVMIVATLIVGGFVVALMNTLTDINASQESRYRS